MPVSPVISTVLFVRATSSAVLYHLLHRPAAADHAVVVEVGVPLVNEVGVLGAQPLVIERAVDHDEQLVDLERLLQVVERAEPHRFDRALDRRVRGHHHDLRHLGGVAGAALSSRIRSRPLSSGIRLSTTSTSNRR